MKETSQLAFEYNLPSSRDLTSRTTYSPQCPHKTLWAFSFSCSNFLRIVQRSERRSYKALVGGSIPSAQTMFPCECVTNQEQGNKTTLRLAWQAQPHWKARSSRGLPVRVTDGHSKVYMTCCVPGDFSWKLSDDASTESNVNVVESSWTFPWLGLSQSKTADISGIFVI
jgi:hypothetical protein